MKLELWSKQIDYLFRERIDHVNITEQTALAHANNIVICGVNFPLNLSAAEMLY